MPSNESQSEFLRQIGVTEAAILDGSASTAHRLEWANRAAHADSVSAPTMTPAAAEFLGDRDPVALDAGSKAMFDHLNNSPIFKPKPEAPVVKEATPLDTPIDWRVAKLDGTRLHSESASLRLEVANAFDRVKRAPTTARETDRLLASQWVARAA